MALTAKRVDRFQKFLVCELLTPRGVYGESFKENSDFGCIHFCPTLEKPSVKLLKFDKFDHFIRHFCFRHFCHFFIRHFCIRHFCIRHFSTLPVVSTFRCKISSTNKTKWKSFLSLKIEPKVSYESQYFEPQSFLFSYVVSFL